jgi:hypothetical protein
MSGGVSVISTAPLQSSVRWSLVIWFPTTAMHGAGVVGDSATIRRRVGGLG